MGGEINLCSEISNDNKNFVFWLHCILGIKNIYFRIRYCLVYEKLASTIFSKIWSPSLAFLMSARLKIGPKFSDIQILDIQTQCHPDQLSGPIWSQWLRLYSANETDANLCVVCQFFCPILILPSLLLPHESSWKTNNKTTLIIEKD